MYCQCLRLVAYGRVQGVGFRPSVCRLAKRFAIQGFVRNLGNGVEIIARGMKENLQAFQAALERLERPAFIESLAKENLSEAEYFPAGGREDFRVVTSENQVSGATFFPADIGICQECEKELLDRGNHRYHYPYISCAACGPRYTIMHSLPYDRLNTTMKKFPLCDYCAAEYRDMTNRRGRAETISCWECGPQLKGLFRDGAAALAGQKALAKAEELLAKGNIIMVKSLGGYNLVCRADQMIAVQNLRQLKQRPSKPFAIMVRDVAQAMKYSVVNSAEEELLQSAVRPIVLLKKRNNLGDLAVNVAFGTAYLGVFLPPMGFYVLLLEKFLALVVTSCNYKGQPILTDDAAAEKFYQDNGIIKGFFTYNREILRPADDSVVQVVDAQRMILRRTRGFLPEPIDLPFSPHTPYALRSVLAVGAQMEPSFCLTQGSNFYLAQVPGHAEQAALEAEWLDREWDWENFLHIKPEVIVGDLHPNYDSTRWGRHLAAQRGVKFLQVQHHQAHALSVMAEHWLQGKVLAVTFDGTGYGDDGTIWGGEFLLCEGTQFRRVAHLFATPVLGGDASMQQAWKSALCYQAAAGLALSSDGRSQLVEMALKHKFNIIPNSSLGRLFDAVGYWLGLGEENTHQGCLAQRVEEAAVAAWNQGIQPLTLHFDSEDGVIYSPASIVRIFSQIDTKNSEDVVAGALGFHNAIAEMVLQVAAKQGVEQIVLSGGCFVNRILLSKCLEKLNGKGFKVYYNQQVSPGDGGLSLGQAYYGWMKENND